MKTSFRRFAYNIFFRLSPLLILLLLELSLRFLGVGESYVLFNVSADKQDYELNPKYYRRFISAEQFPDLDILHQRFPVSKAEHTKRIFLIGDQSFCSLFPDANREQILPGFYGPDSTYYDVVQLAAPLSNSFALAHLVGKLSGYDADACIVLSGAAEFYGLPQKSSWMQDIHNYWGLSAYVTLKAHRFLQVLDRFVYLKRDRDGVFPPADIDQWTVPAGSGQYRESLDFYERNLKRMTGNADFPLFFVNLPVNIKVHPYRSNFNDTEMKDAAIAKECAVLVDNADRFSLDRWIGELGAWEPETAIYYYCLAMINERRGEKEAAVKHYEEALRRDGFRVRPQPGTDRLLREYTALNGNVSVDVRAEAKAAASGGLTVNRFFQNGTALNERGKTFFTDMLRTALTEYYHKSE